MFEKRQVLVLLFAACLLFAGRLSASTLVDNVSPPVVQLHWGDDLSDGPLTDLRKIYVELENTTSEKVVAFASLVFMTDDEPIQVSIGTKKLNAGKKKTLSYKVRAFPVLPRSVSAHVSAHVTVRMPNGEFRKYHSAPRYFHNDSKFNCGIFDPSQYESSLFNPDGASEFLQSFFQHPNSVSISLYTAAQMIDQFNGGLIDPSDPNVDLSRTAVFGRGYE